MGHSEKLGGTFAGVRMRSPIRVPTVHIPITAVACVS